MCDCSKGECVDRKRSMVSEFQVWGHLEFQISKKRRDTRELISPNLQNNSNLKEQVTVPEVLRDQVWSRVSSNRPMEWEPLRTLEAVL